MSENDNPDLPMVTMAAIRGKHFLCQDWHDTSGGVALSLLCDAHRQGMALSIYQKLNSE